MSMRQLHEQDFNDAVNSDNPRDWDALLTFLEQPGSYCNDYCVAAVSEIYGVKIRLLAAWKAGEKEDLHESVYGPQDAAREIVIVNVGNLHFMATACADANMPPVNKAAPDVFAKDALSLFVDGDEARIDGILSSRNPPVAGLIKLKSIRDTGLLEQL